MVRVDGFTERHRGRFRSRTRKCRTCLRVPPHGSESPSEPPSELPSDRTRGSIGTENCHTEAAVGVSRVRDVSASQKENHPPLEERTRTVRLPRATSRTRPGPKQCGSSEDYPASLLEDTTGWDLRRVTTNQTSFQSPFRLAKRNLVEDARADELTADDWLARLDAVPATPDVSSRTKHTTTATSQERNIQKRGSFAWRARAVVLDERLRGLAAAISDAATGARSIICGKR